MRPSSFIPLGTAGLLASADASTIARSQKHTSTLIATEYGTVFDAPVTIGNQTFQMLVDTGSSDTYVMANGYKCIDSDSNMKIPQSECGYSNKTYHKSRTYRHVPGEMFGIEYGAGLSSGEMAYEDVSLNGITVQRQKVGIAHSSTPMGDGVNSGLLGLAYPSITSAHPANHTDNSTYWYDRLPYNPLMYTMHQQTSIDPYFSLALEHTPQNASTAFGGYLTIAGIPPVRHSPDFTTVPVEILKALPKDITSGKRTRSYWATTIKNTKYGTSSNLTTNSTSYQVFLDSGNYIQYLPAAVAEPINALFDPPAVYKEGYEGYVVDCSAKAPEFGLTIGNQTFFHNGQDLIYQTADGVCITNIMPLEKVKLLNQLKFGIIGVPFLKNVVAVFDFGKDEMRFATRVGSKATSTGTGPSSIETPAFSLGAKSIERGSWVKIAVALMASTFIIV